MKKVIQHLQPLLIIVLLPVWFSFIAEAPNWLVIRDAIEKGDAQKLSEFFYPTVTVTVPGYRGHYSNRQARAIIQDFFRNNPPVSFKVKSTGTTASSAVFYLGTYETSSRSVFSVYILLIKESGKTYISQLSFERS